MFMLLPHPPRFPSGRTEMKKAAEPWPAAFDTSSSMSQGILSTARKVKGKIHQEQRLTGRPVNRPLTLRQCRGVRYSLCTPVSPSCPC